MSTLDPKIETMSYRLSAVMIVVGLAAYAVVMTLQSAGAFI